MDFVELKNHFKKDKIISRNDIRLIDPNFDDSQLYRWQKKGYLQKITRAHYIFSDSEINNHLKFQISNQVYGPSYISLESSLNLYGLIPELVFSPTAVTTRRTYQINSPVGTFIYRHIKPELFFGYEIERFQSYCYKIANMEKCLLDFLYLNPGIKTLTQIEEQRIDLELFLEEYKPELFLEYLAKFKTKALEKRIKNLLGVKHD